MGGTGSTSVFETVVMLAADFGVGTDAVLLTITSFRVVLASVLVSTRLVVITGGSMVVVMTGADFVGIVEMSATFLMAVVEGMILVVMIDGKTVVVVTEAVVTTGLDLTSIFLAVVVMVNGVVVIGWTVVVVVVIAMTTFEVLTGLVSFAMPLNLGDDSVGIVDSLILDSTVVVGVATLVTVWFNSEVALVPFATISKVGSTLVKISLPTVEFVSIVLLVVLDETALGLMFLADPWPPLFTIRF